MPEGMGKMELCYLASLLLCDRNNINTEARMHRDVRF